MAWLLRPASAAVSASLAVASFVAVWLLLFPLTRSDGVYRVDEAHKVSETVALRLLLERRWNDPIWFRERVDRTNPQFGKYVFGVAALLAGERLPETPSLSRVAPHARPAGLMPPIVSDDDSRPYLPLLEPARRAALFATAVTSALVAFLAARLYGPAAALLSVAWFARHWMTLQFGPTAIFDPLLACLIFAGGALLLPVITEPKRAMAISPLIALVCAAAFQTRLNGGMALGAALLVLGILALRERSMRTAFAAMVLIILFVLVSVVLNPYYWAAAPADPAIPAQLRAETSLVPRVIGRFRLQVQELGAILQLIEADGIRLPLWAAESRERKPIVWNVAARVRFTWVAIADDVIDGVMLIAAVAGLTLALRRRDSVSLLAIWAAAITVVTLLWLPVPWARYLTPLLPIVALYGGAGCTGLLRRMFRHA